jgi:PPOX class probable F420-dependent enzyme
VATVGSGNAPFAAWKLGMSYLGEIPSRPGRGSRRRGVRRSVRGLCHRRPKGTLLAVSHRGPLVRFRRAHRAAVRGFAYPASLALNLVAVGVAVLVLAHEPRIEHRRDFGGQRRHSAERADRGAPVAAVIVHEPQPTSSSPARLPNVANTTAAALSREKGTARRTYASVVTLPSDLVELLEQPSPCFVATVMPDGGPQLTQTWVDTDGDHVLINTVNGFQKLQNLEHDPRIALNIADPANTSRYFNLSGRVVATTTEGGTEHIERLAQKYLGGPYPWYGGKDQVRVIVTIEVDKVRSVG